MALRVSRDVFIGVSQCVTATGGIAGVVDECANAGAGVGPGPQGPFELLSGRRAMRQTCSFIARGGIAQRRETRSR